ncbi:Twin-arginine translocation pathway signal [Palleronia aestuarii]|nr:Twin-arginine translocation pathway signal [Palleronia aestuarii]
MTRRGLLARGLGMTGGFVIGSGWVAGRTAAWATEVTAIRPETMATLVQMARDLYPHDRIPDENYVVAVKGYDTPDQAPMIEEGVALLDGTAADHGHPNYLGALWETERVDILTALEGEEFFHTIRSGLVTGLYNQKSVWPLFGYEGESFSEGGYIDRGFNDIAWI